MRNQKHPRFRKASQIKAWILNWWQRELPVLSNIQEPVRGKTIDPSQTRREGGRLVFSPAWPLFLTCHIMVIQNVSPLHTKGQEDKSKSAYMTCPIHHRKEGQSVRRNHIPPPPNIRWIVPGSKMNLWKQRIWGPNTNIQFSLKYPLKACPRCLKGLSFFLLFNFTLFGCETGD